MSGGRILDLPGGAVQVVEQGPTAGKPRAPATARRRAADRAPALLRLLAPLVGPDGPAAGQAPSRDPHRPARLRRLREAEERLLDGGAGAPRRPRPGQAPGPGRGRRRPLDGVRRGDRARRPSPASWSTAWSTSTTPRTPSFGDLPFLARLTFTPVIGQALRRIAPDFAIEDGYESAFAPGYDLGDFSDQIIDDYRAMTYTSYDRSAAEADDYGDELPLDQRVRDRRRAAAGHLRRGRPALRRPRGRGRQAYGDVPGARITVLPDAGHSPNVEKPAETSRLVLGLRGAGELAGASPSYCQRPPALAHSSRWSTPQKPSARGARRGGGRAGRGPRRAPRRTASSSTGLSSTEARLGHPAGLPVRSLDRPRNHVLQAAEGRPALARGS